MRCENTWMDMIVDRSMIDAAFKIIITIEILSSGQLNIGHMTVEPFRVTSYFSRPGCHPVSLTQKASATSVG